MNVWPVLITCQETPVGAHSEAPALALRRSHALAGSSSKGRLRGSTAPETDYAKDLIDAIPGRREPA
jgi:hypothetical protein